MCPKSGPIGAATVEVIAIAVIAVVDAVDFGIEATVGEAPEEKDLLHDETHMIEVINTLTLITASLSPPVY